MEMSTLGNESHDVQTLNELLETTFDSIKGYDDAAKEVDNTNFETMFRARADQRRTIASRLQTQVRELGGTPEDSGSTMAAAHRLFANMKNAMTQGDQAVINEVERGEDVIKAEFEKAASDQRLTNETRQLIQEVALQVRETHDEMSHLKHSGVAKNN
jgi:uncharacterized protein (TIGR02284 family)